MSNYKERQKEETEVMEFWDNLITNSPGEFLEHYLGLDLLTKCKLKAFIQVRDKELYNKMEDILCTSSF